MLLRKENYVHNWLTASDPAYLRTKEQMKEIFCPESEQWRSMVIAKSMEIVTQADLAMRKPE
jgi:hypothetical protein